MSVVVSNRNVIIPSPDGKTSCHLNKGYIGPVPNWVPKTAYFKALAADGKVVLSASGKDKEVDKRLGQAGKANEKAARKAAAESEPPREALEDTGEVQDASGE